MVRAIRRTGAWVRTTKFLGRSAIGRTTASRPLIDSGRRGLYAAVFASCRHLGPPRRSSRGTRGKSNGRELLQSSYIDGTLEVDHLAHRLPVMSPAPLIEFRLG